MSYIIYLKKLFLFLFFKQQQRRDKMKGHCAIDLCHLFDISHCHTHTHKFILSIFIHDETKRSETDHTMNF